MGKREEVTIGNHSYVEVDIVKSYGQLEFKEAKHVLEIINSFEHDHPELEITNWHAEYRYQVDYDYPVGIEGLFIDHRMK